MVGEHAEQDLVRVESLPRHRKNELHVRKLRRVEIRRELRPHRMADHRGRVTLRLRRRVRVEDEAPALPVIFGPARAAENKKFAPDHHCRVTGAPLGHAAGRRVHDPRPPAQRGRVGGLGVRRVALHPGTGGGVENVHIIKTSRRVAGPAEQIQHAVHPGERHAGTGLRSLAQRPDLRPSASGDVEQKQIVQPFRAVPTTEDVAGRKKWYSLS